MIINHRNIHHSRHLALSLAPDPYKNGIPLFEAVWRTLIADRTRRTASDLVNPAPVEFGELCQSYERVVETSLHMLGLDKPLRSRIEFIITDRLRESELDQIPANLWQFAMQPRVKDKRFAVTSDGWISLVPPFSKVGDVVYVIEGCQVPLLLRKVKSQDRDETGETRYELVGECYIHRIMDGEAVEGVAFEEIVLQ